MSRRYLYLCLVIFGIVALYPSSAMIMFWVDIWTRGAKLLFEPDLALRTIETALTFIGFSFQIGVLFYFFLRFLKMPDE